MVMYFVSSDKLGRDKLKPIVVLGRELLNVADGEVLDCACILGLCLRLVKRPRPRSRLLLFC
jgi:hypothetical protein